MKKILAAAAVTATVGLGTLGLAGSAHAVVDPSSGSSPSSEPSSPSSEPSSPTTEPSSPETTPAYTPPDVSPPQSTDVDSNTGTGTGTTVDNSDVSSALPNTGGPDGLLLGGAAALLLAGGTAVVVARRRQTD